MKKKILLSMFVGIALVGAISPIVSITNVNNKENSKNEVKNITNIPQKTVVDYSLVKKIVNNFTTKHFYYQNNIKLSKEQEEKIINLQNEYFNLFNSNNYSLEEIQTYMCENFPQYKEEQEKQKNNIDFVYQEKRNYLFLKDKIDIDKLKEKNNELEIQRVVLLLLPDTTTLTKQAGAICEFTALVIDFILQIIEL